MNNQILCCWCDTLVTHSTRQINGCNCDPDAPTWCYITMEGHAKGLRQSKFKVLPIHED